MELGAGYGLDPAVAQALSWSTRQPPISSGRWARVATRFTGLAYTSQPLSSLSDA